jgi:hypothetical protein
MNVFTGWDEREAVKKEMYSGRNRLFSLRFKPGEPKLIRLLHDAPLTVYEHSWKDADGKWNFKFCWGDNCPYCKDGHYKTLRGVHLAWDYSEWEDKNGETHKGSLMLWKYSNAVGDSLRAIHMANGELDKFDLTVVRIGTKQKTTYTVLPKNNEPLSASIKEQLEEIKAAMLPEGEKFTSWTNFLKTYLEGQIEEDTKNFLPVTPSGGAADVDSGTDTFYESDDSGW